jgi:murein DD-endopeptidase MepM/ murein hydrolase activator NlpD
VARKIEVEVVGDTKSIEAAFKRTSKAGRNLEKDLLAVGKRAALAVGALGVAAGAASFKLVKMAGDAEEVRSKFKVTFQQEMPRMVSQLDAFSKATGASRFELRKQAADLGALLVPLSSSRREAGNLSVQFTKLATDLSSFNNVPVEEALLAIRSGLVGEAEPLRRFGVLLNEAAVKAEAYRSGIAKVGAVLTEQQKVQARANLIMAQTKLAQGDATRTADSFTNQLRKLKNQVSDTATELGLKLLPIATLVLNKLNEWGPAIAQRVQPHLDALGAWADAHRQEFRDLFTEITANAKTAGLALKDMGKGADNVASAMGGWDNAFQLVITGLLASKLSTILKRLSGPGSILASLKNLKTIGPIVIALNIRLIDDATGGKISDLNDWIFNNITAPIMGALDKVVPGDLSPRKSKPSSGAGAGALDALTGGSALTSSKGVQLPTKFKVTHQTSGLAGFPATDIFAKAGSPVLAPENGRVVSVRPFNSDPDFYGMAIYYLGASGATYYIKHIYDPSPVGSYKRGDVLGKVAQGTTGGPHVHFGKRTGPGIPIPVSKAGAGGGGTGGGTGGVAGVTAGGKAPTTRVEELIPGRQRLALARAEGTKNIGDDLTALRAMVAYLQKLLPKTKDIEKRIEITEALNGLRSRIAELGKEGKKADVSDAIDYEALKKRLRESFREGIEQARQKIVDARAGFTAAFGILSESLLQVFDAKTQKMLDNLRVQVAGFGFDTAAGEETPTERLIRERGERRTDAGLARARQDAKTPEEILAADEALEDRRLDLQARAERAAADTAIENERKRIQVERDVQRQGFTDALTDLQAHWNKTNATAATRTKELRDLMAKFGLPFEEVGSLLGTSFATGFLASLQIVFDRLGDLARELNKVTPGQAAEAAMLASQALSDPAWLTALKLRSAGMNAKYGLGGLPTFQRGGIVPGSGPQLAVVHGGESIFPRGQGPSGVVVNVYGDVTGTQLVETVRREINRIQKQNSRTGYV